MADGPRSLIEAGLASALVSSHQRPAWELGRTGVRALAVFASVLAVAAAVLTWRARPTVEPLASIPVDSPAVARTPTPGANIVAVSGLVRRPGLVHLPGGARVADA